MSRNSMAHLGLLAAMGIVLVREIQDRKALAAQVKDLSATLDFLAKYNVATAGTAVNVDPSAGSDDTTTPGRGSDSAPFKTVKAAVAAIGNARNQADYEGPRMLLLAAGVHDLAGTVLPTRQWAFQLAPGAFITGGFSQQLVAAQMFTSTNPPTLSIEKIQGGSEFVAANSEQDLDGSIAITQGSGPNVTAWAGYFKGIVMQGVSVPATVTAGFIVVDHVITQKPVLFSAGALDGDYYVNTDLVTVKQMHLNRASFAFSVTLTTGAATIFNSQFNAVASKTFTGPALSLGVDGNSNVTFNSNAWVLGGAATKTNLDGFAPFV